MSRGVVLSAQRRRTRFLSPRAVCSARLSNSHPLGRNARTAFVMGDGAARHLRGAWFKEWANIDGNPNESTQFGRMMTSNGDPTVGHLFFDSNAETNRYPSGHLGMSMLAVHHIKDSASPSEQIAGLRWYGQTDSAVTSGGAGEYVYASTLATGSTCRPRFYFSLNKGIENVTTELRSGPVTMVQTFTDSTHSGSQAQYGGWWAAGSSKLGHPTAYVDKAVTDSSPNMTADKWTFGDNTNSTASGLNQSSWAMNLTCDWATPWLKSTLMRVTHNDPYEFLVW